MHVSAQRLLKRRPLSLAIATLLLAVSPAFTPAPSAKTSDDCLWYQAYNYYSDATHTNAVGYRVYYCDGYIGRSGIQTYYYTAHYCDCMEEGGK
jgi:hypothetical protein